MNYKKEILDFEYFFFNPLSHGDVETFLRERSPGIREPAARVIYSGWLDTYKRKAVFFYQSQYRRHQSLTWLSFCQHYEIPDYETPANFDLEYEWVDWKENYQLSAHDEKYESMQELFGQNDTTQQYDAHSNNDNLFSHGDISHKEIDEIWFNSQIKNSVEIAEKLRSLSYDKYLETSHWKKVRSAMILINTAICQAKECAVVGESWYGGSESELQIHHLDYSNRGNERFKDLAVLCRRHHEMIHQKKRNRTF